MKFNRNQDLLNRGEVLKYSGNPNKFFSPSDSARINEAIAECERNTSAEIKLSVARHCWGEINDKAKAIFKKLCLYKTSQRNCVLILLVLSNREFIIYGDSGINSKVGQEFWDEVRNAMAADFKNNNFADGVIKGAKMAGEKLAQYFPPEANDNNEISDEIAYEE